MPESTNSLKINKYYPLAGYIKINQTTLELIPGLDGVGRAGWILVMSDNTLVVASFEWGVRPGSKAIVSAASQINSGKVSIIPVALEHSGLAKRDHIYPALSGTIGNLSVNLTPNHSWTNISDPEFLSTLKKYGLKIKSIARLNL